MEPKILVSRRFLEKVIKIPVVYALTSVGACASQSTKEGILDSFEGDFAKKCYLCEESDEVRALIQKIFHDLRINYF